MERREFCRFAAACTLAAGTGGLAGCARALEWSSTERVREAPRPSPPAEPPSIAPGADAASAPPAPDATTPERDTSEVPPDLAVFSGNDPAANVRAAIGAMGGMGRFVKRNARVVVKPNMLTARAPEYAATTNPEVVAAIVTLAFEAGARDVVVFDRPTSPPRNVYQVSGIAAAVQRAGGRMKVLTDRDYERFRIPDGRILTSWPFVGDIFDADTFVSVPIAKTHGLAGLTLAMKNHMGVMGGVRGLIHQDFHVKIVDVASVVRPHLVVLDAYRMLVANGPSGGDLSDVRTAKTVVVGTNAASVDAFGATLFGWRPNDLEYVRIAGDRGLGETDIDKLEIRKGRI